VHIGRRDVDRKRQAERVDEDVALAPFHVLVGVKPTGACGLLDGLHALAVHDGGAWMGILAQPATFSCSQLALEMSPEARATKLPKVIVHRLPGRKGGGQIAPGTAGTQQIEERIEDAAQ
jgi:hypothetical protein